MGTIALYFISQRTAANKTLNSDNKVEVISSSKKKSEKKKSARKAAEPKSSATTAANDSEKDSENTKTSDSVDSSSSSEPSSSSSSQESSSTDESNGTYVTVGAGQGLYRVATNNGLSVNELLQLNPGLSAGSTINPGQRVRIK